MRGTRTQKLRELVNRGATEGEREAARRALAVHEGKLLSALPVVEVLPPGPDLARRGGPFPAREFDGRVWVAVRAGEAEARAWVDDRRRMLVKLGGERFAMIPTAVETDDERQQVYVTAPVEALGEW